MEHHVHSESCHHGETVTEDQSQLSELTDEAIASIQAQITELVEKAAANAAAKKDNARKARNKRKGAVRLAKVKAKNKEEMRKAKKGISLGTVLALREVHKTPSPDRTRKVLRDARRKQADAMRRINRLKMTSSKVRGQTSEALIIDESTVAE